MDLIADIGNTHCHLAAFSQGAIVARRAVRGDRPVGEMEREWETFSQSLPRKVERAAVASVNPKVKIPFVKWLKERVGVTPLVLGESLRLDIVVDVDAPDEVGADRVVNALWAKRKLPGQAVIVVDFGTAISFDVVNSKGAFVGGAIAPGVGTQARALSERTALLPHITVTRNPRPIGRDTVACIDAGIFWGAVGLVDLLTEKMEAALGEKAIVIGTGGDASLIATGSKRMERVVPDMTLEGVHLALVEATRG